MAAELADEPDHGRYLAAESGCPPEYADWSLDELMARFDAEEQGNWTAGSGSPAPTDPGSGFESGGPLDTGVPGAVLAGRADAVTCDGGLAGLADDELIGVMRAWQRLQSWCSSGLMASVAELARRRPADRTPAAAPGQFPGRISEFAVDEVAAALTLTSRAADTLFATGLDLETRLPLTARAQHQGQIDQARARLIAEMTRILSDEDAARVEALIFPKATGQTTGQLRVSLARAILAVDPAAAARRREEALKDPRVRRWREDAGTAALAGYNLPPADVLAADQRLSGRAHALRAAGLPGTLEELRARAYLDALLDRDSAPAQPPGPAPAQPPGPARDGLPGDSGEPGGPSKPASPSGPSEPGGPVPVPPIASRVVLTVPLDTGLGHAGTPGTVAGFGPVDGPLARDLLTSAAAHPASRFCLTVTGPDGQAIGHSCLPGPHAWQHLTTRGLTLAITPLARGRCDHQNQEPGYQPSRRLQHLITARNPTCTAPGCPRAATRCDLDHTTPYDQGGRTCECGLAPLCRHHHRCKQSQGWRLEQPQPGILTWTTPAGRHHTTQPDTYP